MEILIPGLLLVAFMAWASTRIKRNAAAAFDAETIETDEIIVNKPERFLHVLNDTTGNIFRAYSKDFGTVGRQEIRQATIEVRRHRDRSLDDAVEAARSGAESFESVTPYLDAGERALTARSVLIREGAEMEVHHKFVTRGHDVVEARAELLFEHKDEYVRSIEEMLETLRVK